MSAVLALDLDRTLARVLGGQLRDPEVPAVLRDAIAYSLFAPGKRLRPRLTVATARLCGVPDAAAWQAAAAVESVHCASLIHDDLPAMDDDDFRRGLPSNHRVHGEANAILAGVALIVMGAESLAEAVDHGCDARAVNRALRRLLRAVGPAGLCGGQAAELAGVVDAAELARVRRMKTTSLFEASILVAADLAPAPLSAAHERALSELATALGDAFQMADDLEDAATDRADQNLVGHGDPRALLERACDRLAGAARGLGRQFGSDAAPLETIGLELVSRIRAHVAETTPRLAVAGGRA